MGEKCVEEGNLGLGTTFLNPFHKEKSKDMSKGSWEYGSCSGIFRYVLAKNIKNEVKKF